PARWRRLLAFRCRYGIGSKQTISFAEFLIFAMLWLVSIAVSGLVHNVTRQDVWLFFSMLFWPLIFVPVCLRWKKYQSVKAEHLKEVITSSEELPLWNDDWIRVSPSRLQFPPICSDCGTGTTETIVDRRLEPLGIPPLNIPLCAAC